MKNQVTSLWKRKPQSRDQKKIRLHRTWEDSLKAWGLLLKKKGRAFAPFQPWRLVPIQLLWFFKGENHHKLQESHCAYRKHRTEGSPGGTIQHLTSVQPVMHSNTGGCCADTVSLTLCTHSFTKQSPDPWGIQSWSLPASALQLNEEEDGRSACFILPGTAQGKPKYSSGTAKCKFNFQFSWKKNVLVATENVPFGFQPASDLQWQTLSDCRRAHRQPDHSRRTSTCSAMAWGSNEGKISPGVFK